VVLTALGTPLLALVVGWLLGGREPASFGRVVLA